jgi:hypothetical protein
VRETLQRVNQVVHRCPVRLYLELPGVKA